MASFSSTAMPRCPQLTLPGLGPRLPVRLRGAPRRALSTLRGLRTPLPCPVTADPVDQTAPILLLHPLDLGPPITAASAQRAAPPPGRAPSTEPEDWATDPALVHRRNKARRFGYRAILFVAALALAELVYLLLS